MPDPRGLLSCAGCRFFVYDGDPEGPDVGESDPKFGRCHRFAPRLVAS